MKTATNKTTATKAGRTATRTTGAAQLLRRTEELRREMVRLYHLAEHIEEAYPGRGAGDSLHDCFVDAAYAYARVAARTQKTDGPI